jgi:hypothetical protein
VEADVDVEIPKSAVSSICTLHRLNVLTF